MSITHCPTCGTELSGRAICPRCGTLARVEFKLNRLQERSGKFVESRLASFQRGFQPHHFLWACATIPIFILPPLVSLVAAFKFMRSTPSDAAINETVSFEWIAIVSLLNILLSGLFLYKFHFSPAEIAGFFIDLLRALFHTLTQYLPGAPSAPKLIPA